MRLKDWRKKNLAEPISKDGKLELWDIETSDGLETHIIRDSQKNEFFTLTYSIKEGDVNDVQFRWLR